jgi:hypothetical protein
VIRAHLEDPAKEDLDFFRSPNPAKDAGHFWERLRFWYRDDENGRWCATWKAFQFPEDVSFSGSTLSGSTRHGYQGRASLAGATFLGKADFHGVKFTQRADFTGARFLKSADLSDAEFGQSDWPMDGVSTTPSLALIRPLRTV